MSEIVASFKALFDEFKKESLFFVEITENSEAKTKGICKGKIVQSPNVEIYNIFLQNIKNDSGIILIPKVGSKVIVKEIGTDRAFILLYSEIDEIIVDCPKTTFNSGNNGGLVIIAELVSKINALESKINTMNTLLKSHVHPETGATTSPSPSLASLADINPLTQVSDLENPNVNH